MAEQLTGLSISMKSENAQKCWLGTKTETRRLDGLEEVNASGSWGYPQMTRPGVWTFLDLSLANPYDNALDVVCPFGVVGDRLWVQEEWSWPGEEAYLYKGNPEHVRLVEEWKHDSNCCQVAWCPSITMPRAACRTVLEITNIHVERLNYICVEDVIREGVNRIAHGMDGYYYSAFRDEPHHDNWIHPEDAYKELWESIYGNGSWDANPWVWVITFRKVGG